MATIRKRLISYPPTNHNKDYTFFMMPLRSINGVWKINEEGTDIIWRQGRSWVDIDEDNKDRYVGFRVPAKKRHDYDFWVVLSKRAKIQSVFTIKLRIANKEGLGWYHIVKGKHGKVVGYVKKNEGTDNLFKKILEKYTLSDTDKIYVAIQGIFTLGSIKWRS